MFRAPPCRAKYSNSTKMRQMQKTKKKTVNKKVKEMTTNENVFFVFLSSFLFSCFDECFCHLLCFVIFFFVIFFLVILFLHFLNVFLFFVIFFVVNVLGPKERGPKTFEFLTLDVEYLNFPREIQTPNINHQMFKCFGPLLWAPRCSQHKN